MSSSSICDQNVFVSKKKKKQKTQKEKKKMMLMLMRFFAFLEHFCKAILSLHLLAFFCANRTSAAAAAAFCDLNILVPTTFGVEIGELHR
jgi:hypothetical protein